MTEKPYQVGSVYPELCKLKIKLSTVGEAYGRKWAHLRIEYYELKYQDIDGYSWRDPKEFLPLPFDLVKIKTYRRELPGWWDGNEWNVRQMHGDESVLMWKKKDEV